MSYVQERYDDVWRTRTVVQTSSSSTQLLRISNLMVMTWKSERDGLRRQDAEHASRHEYRVKNGRNPPVTTHRVYHEPGETNPASDREREPASSSRPPSESAQAETTHTPVKRLRLQGKQQVQSDGERQTQTQNRESSVTTHVDTSQPMDLSGMPERVRLNMKRSPFERQGDRSKQRRVMEDPDEDEVMIGEVQVNEEVEYPM